MSAHGRWTPLDRHADGLPIRLQVESDGPCSHGRPILDGNTVSLPNGYYQWVCGECGVTDIVLLVNHLS